eukprot:1351030-Pleurochrysis_carterae.AAC.6
MMHLASSVAQVVCCDLLTFVARTSMQCCMHLHTHAVPAASPLQFPVFDPRVIVLCAFQWSPIASSRCLCSSRSSLSER